MYIINSKLSDVLPAVPSSERTEYHAEVISRTILYSPYSPVSNLPPADPTETI